MKMQVVYETNLDYEASYQKLVESNLLIVDITEKGLLWIKFKDFDTIFNISPQGKIQVKWKNSEEKKFLLKLLKNLLVPRYGELKIKPSKQQIWIDYPPPPNFKLYWCDEETTYKKVPQTERGIIIRTEEPIPIIPALELMDKYPIAKIEQKKSIWKRIKDWLNSEVEFLGI